MTKNLAKSSKITYSRQLAGIGDRRLVDRDFNGIELRDWPMGDVVYWSYMGRRPRRRLQRRRPKRYHWPGARNGWWVGLSQADACSYHPPFCLHPSIYPLFNTTLWSTWSTGVTWTDVQVGDFNGDGKSDITGRALETGEWCTGLSNDFAFTTTKWATWSTGVTWITVRTGDFA